MPVGSHSTRCEQTYAEQIAATAEGGVDLLLVETIFGTALNAKAAIVAAARGHTRSAACSGLSFTAINKSGSGPLGADGWEALLGLRRGTHGH